MIYKTYCRENDEQKNPHHFCHKCCSTLIGANLSSICILWEALERPGFYFLPLISPSIGLVMLLLLLHFDAEKKCLNIPPTCIGESIHAATVVVARAIIFCPIFAIITKRMIHKAFNVLEKEPQFQTISWKCTILMLDMILYLFTQRIQLLSFAINSGGLFVISVFIQHLRKYCATNSIFFKFHQASAFQKCAPCAFVYWRLSPK